MTMRRALGMSCLAVAACLGLAFCDARPADAADGDAPPADGAAELEVEETDAPHLTLESELYRQYCGACHGRRGRGDGIVAPFLDPPPIDLTLIQRGFEGEFPRYLVVMSVDGRETVRAHGTSSMPVWGEVFAEELLADDPAASAKARGKVMKIVDYVESIQR